MAGQAKINLNKLRIEMQGPMERAFREKATKIVTDKFNEAKQEFLEKFLDEDVTKELKKGPNATGGILGVPGNLYSFIGFDEGTQPIKILYDFLQEHIQIEKNPVYNKSRKVYSFRVNIPTRDEIASVTPMPWGTAVSWAFAVEEGISGLNHYLSNQRKAKKGKKKKVLGRSTGGIQIEGAIGGGADYTPVEYLTPLFKFLREALS